MTGIVDCPFLFFLDTRGQLLKRTTWRHRVGQIQSTRKVWHRLLPLMSLPFTIHCGGGRSLLWCSAVVFVMCVTHIPRSPDRTLMAMLYRQLASPQGWQRRPQMFIDETRKKRTYLMFPLQVGHNCSQMMFLMSGSLPQEHKTSCDTLRLTTKIKLTHRHRYTASF